MLHHILKKYLQVCMLLLNIHYKKSHFPKISFNPSNKIFFESIRIYTMLFKGKTQLYFEPLTKSFFNCIFFGCNCSSRTMLFLKLANPLKYLLILCFEAFSYNVIFHSSKDRYRSHTDLSF